jgi:hypothetical protein
LHLDANGVGSQTTTVPLDPRWTSAAVYPAPGDPSLPAGIMVVYGSALSGSAFFFNLTVDAEADASGVPSAPLHVGLYQDAQQAGAAALGRPGFDFSEGTDCDASIGSFYVSAVDVTPTYVEQLTVAFLNFCVGSPVPLRGCLHVEHIRRQ